MGAAGLRSRLESGNPADFSLIYSLMFLFTYMLGWEWEGVENMSSSSLTRGGA